MEAVVSSISLSVFVGAEDCRVIGSEAMGVAVEGVPPSGRTFNALSSHSALPGAAPEGGGLGGNWGNGTVGTGVGWVTGTGVAVAGLLNWASSCARLAVGVPVGAGAGAIGACTGVGT